MSDLSALSQARAFEIGETIFKLLPIGARFVFQKHEATQPFAILIKTSPRGYRHEVGGRQWDCGARAACFRLEDKQ